MRAYAQLALWVPAAASREQMIGNLYRDRRTCRVSGGETKKVKRAASRVAKDQRLLRNRREYRLQTIDEIAPDRPRTRSFDDADTVVTE